MRIILAGIAMFIRSFCSHTVLPLGEVVKAGVLENWDEPDVQYRWNAAFVGSWEILRDKYMQGEI